MKRKKKFTFIFQIKFRYKNELLIFSFHLLNHKYNQNTILVPYGYFGSIKEYPELVNKYIKQYLEIYESKETLQSRNTVLNG